MQLWMRLQAFEDAHKPKGKLPTGVLKTDTGKYQARIKLDGKRFNLGSFETPEEAASAYRTAKYNGFTVVASPKKIGVKRGTGAAALALLASCLAAIC